MATKTKPAPRTDAPADTGPRVGSLSVHPEHGRLTGRVAGLKQRKLANLARISAIDALRSGGQVADTARDLLSAPDLADVRTAGPAELAAERQRLAAENASIDLAIEEARRLLTALEQKLAPSLGADAGERLAGVMDQAGEALQALGRCADQMDAIITALKRAKVPVAAAIGIDPGAARPPFPGRAPASLLQAMYLARELTRKDPPLPQA